MRRTYNSNFLKYKDQIIGFCFGADAVTEHEIGIKELRNSLGMKDVASFDRFIVHNYDSLEVYEKDNEMLVIYSPGPHYYLSDKKDSFEQHCRYNELLCWGPAQTIVAAWDECSFGIHAVGEESIDLLKKNVIEPWQDHDVAILAASISMFYQSGLFIVRASTFPEKIKETFTEKLRDKEKLQKASDKINLASKLRKAGKRFYALSPRWAKDSDIETKYPVVYWLNPADQRNNNYGYFSVEQLLQWTKNEGPIPKNKKE